MAAMRRAERSSSYRSTARLVDRCLSRTNFVRHLLLSLALLSTACGRKSAEPVRIAIGGQAQLIYLAATLAEELGYYRDAGVAVSLIDFPGGAKALEAVLGGSADVV